MGMMCGEEQGRGRKLRAMGVRSRVIGEGTQPYRRDHQLAKVVTSIPLRTSYELHNVIFSQLSFHCLC